MAKMIYSKRQAEKALEFWQKKLNESCNEADLPDMETTLEDEQVNEAQKYAPNTVGAVIELLKKSDPNGRLLIRLLPNNSECMLVDVSRTITDNGEITMFDVAKGSPED